MPIKKKSERIINEATAITSATEVEKKVKVAERQVIENLNLSTFKPSTSVSLGRIASAPGAATIVNSKKNGKRVTISSSTNEHLDHPESVQILMSDDSIAIGENLPGCKLSYTVKSEGKEGKKGVIYAGPLVEEITDHFSLDFSERVSITFTEATYTRIGEYPVAVIKVIDANPIGTKTDSEEARSVDDGTVDTPNSDGISEANVLEAESSENVSESALPATTEA